MVFETILYPIKHGKPEAKFFLLNFLQEFGELSSGAIKVAELAQKFGLTVSATDAAIAKLRDLELLDREEVHARLGRPSYSYKCSGLLAFQNHRLSSSKSLAADGLNVLPIVEELIKPTADTLFELKIPLRLLLAALLVNAKGLGLVAGIGTADLGAMTGMKSDRLRSHLKALQDSGYITRVIPGITGARLFGVQKAIYALNLEHTSYKSISGYQPVYEKQGKAIVLPDELESYIRKSFKPHIARSDPRIEKCKEFFKSKEQDKIIEYFQSRVEIYACELLTALGDELAVTDMKTLPKIAKCEPIYEAISSVIVAPKLIREPKKNDPPPTGFRPNPEQCSALADLVYGMVVWHAKKMADTLAQGKIGGMAGEKFHIFPKDGMRQLVRYQPTDNLISSE